MTPTQTTQTTPTEMTESIAPKNKEQALALALILAIQATDKEKAHQCIQHADTIADEMHPAEVQAIRDVVEICLNVL